MEPLANTTSSKTDYEKLLTISVFFIIFASAFHLFSLVTADPDLWGHLKFGMDHVKQGALEWTDPYSFTAYGYTWINHEWLCEVIFYLVYKAFSDAGLLYGKLLMGFAALGFLILACFRRTVNPLVLAVTGVLALIGMSPGFMIRPQLFSFLFFGVFLYVLQLYFTGRRNLLFLLPILTALWVNLHGGFLMGWALMLVVTGWETFSHVILRRKRDGLRKIWAAFIALNLATLINPYGYRLHVFLWETLTFTPDITEWNRLYLFDFSYPYVKALMVLYLLCAIFDRKNVRGWEFWAVAMTLFATLKHERHSVFFAMSAMPFIVNHASNKVRDLKSRYPGVSISPPSKLAITVFMCLAAAMLTARGASIYAASDSRIFVDFDKYPAHAVAFMKKNRIQGNVLVPFDWGEYVLWHLYPESKVSIDGRFTTSYPDSVIDPHFLAIDDEAGWKRLVEKFPSDVIIARQIPYFQKLAAQKNPTWIYVYSDRLSIVFIKYSLKNSELLKRFVTGRFVYSNKPLEPFFP